MSKKVVEKKISINTGARLGPTIAEAVQGIAEEAGAEPEEPIIVMLALSVVGLCALADTSEDVAEMVAGISADVIAMVELQEAEKLKTKTKPN